MLSSNLEYNFSYIVRHIILEFCKTLENMNMNRTFMGPDFAETFVSNYYLSTYCVKSLALNLKSKTRGIDQGEIDLNRRHVVGLVVVKPCV